MIIKFWVSLISEQSFVPAWFQSILDWIISEFSAKNNDTNNMYWRVRKQV